MQSPTEAPRTAARRGRIAAWILFTALVLLLAFRLSTIETLRETLAQKSVHLHPPADLPEIPTIGPAYTAVYAAFSLLVAGIASFAAAKSRALSRRTAVQFLLIAAILALAVLSAFHAQNRFSAIVGAADLITSLAAAWTMLLLCHQNLLGDRARRLFAAAIVGLCAIACAKSLVQHYIEYPDLAQYIKEHKEQALQSQGISDDPVNSQLFLTRIASNEVSGFALDSDVLATELLPAAGLLTLLLFAGMQWFSSARDPRDRSPPKSAAPLEHARPKTHTHAQPQIPPEALALPALALLAIIAALVLFWTASKGGIACALLLAAAVLAGLFARDWLFRHRRAVLLSAATFAILAAASVLLYGLAKDSLPSKSLLYRWHYWTASGPIIRESPALGVGLNNFGDYYLQFKRPSSPEDVKDPHNFFIRLAAEAGIPAACLIALLILSWLTGAMPCGVGAPLGMFRETDIPKKPTSPARPIAAHQTFLPILLISLTLAVAWALLHALLTEPINEYTLIVTFIYAIIGWAFFLAAWLLLNIPSRTDPQSPLVAPRTLAVILAVAALAMLLYDQINIALVTGPVAMLFWMILASANLGPASASKPTASGGGMPWAQYGITAVFLAASLTTLFTFTLPTCAGRFPWDPAPYETAYLHAAANQDWPAAADSLDAALARSPRSIELLLQRIALDHDHLHRPIAADIRRIFFLDRSNASLRVTLALPDSDLPAPERLAALQDALAFDAQLPPAEYKRLPPATLAAIHAKIQELRQSTHQTP